MPNIYLSGLKLQGYRGIGNTLQTLAPFRAFNFFIGANNAGKSTVLSFISTHMPAFTQQSNRPELAALDLFSKGDTRIKKVVAAQGIPLVELQKSAIENLQNNRNYLNFNLETLINGIVRLVCDKQAMLWAYREVPEGDDKRPKFEYDEQQIRASLSHSQWETLWGVLHPGTGGGSLDTWVRQSVKKILDLAPLHIPRAYMIPAIREIKQAEMYTSGQLSDYSGAGLINRLAEIQSPDHDKLSDRVLFEQITKFLANVTGVVDAKIVIPHNRQHVLVEMNGKVLPLSSLGTGIHEVIMLASFCTLIRESIICMEEPEIHLHPLLQRKLIKYLAENTSNQYFIATHSASFIDTPEAAIFHVTNVDGETHIRESILNRERFSICTDLGYRASDLVQANAVVWVEGPSDRIYIAKWLKYAAPELIEGIHYSIMFYGGRLLSHLSADDDVDEDEVKEFIALRSLNRHIAIVIDSDRESEESNINATKQRLLDECQEHGGFVWITDGREIENYVSHDQLQKAVENAYRSSYSKASKGGKYDHALYFYRNKTLRNDDETTSSKAVLEKNIDKVKVAKLVCACDVDLQTLDLETQIRGLASMIRDANDLEVAGSEPLQT